LHTRHESQIMKRHKDRNIVLIRSRVIWWAYETVHSSRSLCAWINDTKIIYWRNRGERKRERERERLSRVRARTRRRVTSRPSSGRDLNVTRFTQVLRAKGYITWLQRASSSGITPLRSARLCIPYVVRKKSKQAPALMHTYLDFYICLRRYTMMPQQLCITTESFPLGRRSQCMPLSENCDKRKLKWLLLPCGAM